MPAVFGPIEGYHPWARSESESAMADLYTPVADAVDKPLEARAAFLSS